MEEKGRLENLVSELRGEKNKLTQQVALLSSKSSSSSMRVRSHVHSSHKGLSDEELGEREGEVTSSPSSSPRSSSPLLGSSSLNKPPSTTSSSPSIASPPPASMLSYYPSLVSFLQTLRFSFPFLYHILQPVLAMAPPSLFFYFVALHILLLFLLLL